MIRLENLTKAFSFRGQRKLVADNVSLTLPAGKAIGLLGRNGSGKSTLLRIIAGTVPPDRGRVITEGQISWPVGLAGGMHPDLTGMQNTRFLGRIYGVDTDELVDFVQHFSELSGQQVEHVRQAGDLQVDLILPGAVHQRPEDLAGGRKITKASSTASSPAVRPRAFSVWAKLTWKSRRARAAEEQHVALGGGVILDPVRAVALDADVEEPVRAPSRR
jgi:energy-coupling factor transporter ATP-binding protein EcfA2